MFFYYYFMTFKHRNHSWSLVVTRGHSWSLVVTRGHSWSLVVTRGHSWSLVVTRGHSWSLVVTRGHSWSLVVTRGHSWSFVVTRGHSWSFVVTRGHSWSLVVTRGHSCVLLDKTLVHTRIIKIQMLNCYCQLSSSVIFRQYGVSQSECKIDRPRPGLPRVSPTWNDKSGGEIEENVLFTLQVAPVLFEFFC